METNIENLKRVDFITIPINEEIKLIPIPEALMDTLKPLGPAFIQSINKYGASGIIKTGIVKLDQINNEVKVASIFFGWATDTNEIIENLNLTISDLRNLPSRHLIHGGSPKQRFYLLVRTYFYEFYRFRETFNQAIKALERFGYGNREQTRKLRCQFKVALKEVITLRNLLVHQDVNWAGMDHYNLSIVEMYAERGMAIKSLDTGEVLTIKSALEALCDPTADVFEAEGNRTSDLISDLINCFLGVEPQEQKE